MYLPVGELRRGFRNWRREWPIALATLLPLSMILGLNIAIFSFVKAIFLNPLPAVRDVRRLVALQNSVPAGEGSPLISYPNYESYQSSLASLSGLAAVQTFQTSITDPPAQTLLGQMVTGNYFDLLRVDLALGRSFLPEEERPTGGRPVLVLAHSLWRNRFHADPAILGREAHFGGRSFTVVGVAAEGFAGLDPWVAAEFWAPLGAATAFDMSLDQLQHRDNPSLQVFGRLRSGVSIAAAQAELHVAAASLAKVYPSENRGHSPILQPVLGHTLPPNLRAVIRNATLTLMGAVFLLLLLACTNIGQLFFLRNLAQAKNLTIRLALGATRGRLAGVILGEALPLALLAVPLALLFAILIRNYLWAQRPAFLGEAALALKLDGRVLLFTALLVPITAILISLLSLVPVLKPGIGEVIKGRWLRPLSSSRWSSVRPAEVILTLEVALCVVAISCCSLYLRHLRASLSPTLGFDQQNLVIARVSWPRGSSDAVRARAFQDEIVARAGRLLGTSQVGLGENQILGGFRSWVRVFRGDETDSLDKLPQVGSSWVSPGYFDTVRIPLLGGRGFLDSDREDSPPVAVLSRSLGDRLFPQQDAVGRTLYLEDSQHPLQVVGIVDDVPALSLQDLHRPFLYRPRGQRFTSRFTMHLRPIGSAAEAVGPLQRLFEEMEPGLPVEIGTMEQILRRSLWLPRATLFLLSLFSGLAVVLATIGVAAVTTQSLLLHKEEIALRFALGARRSSVLWARLRSTLGLAAFGTLAGYLVGVPVGRWLSRSLALSSGFDLDAVLVAAATLTAALTLSTAIPAFLQSRQGIAAALREGSA